MKQTTKNKNLFRIFAVLLLAALWVTIPFILNDKTVSADDLSDTRIQASLSGGAINGVTPAGFSEWRLDDSGRRRLEVQASSVNLRAGTVLTIVVNNAAVGQMTVNSFGAAFFRIDTNDGQTVPVINFGNPIQVNHGETVILTGTYGTVTPTPSPSGSPNASPSPSASPSASPSGTPSASPSPSPSASPNASPTPTASPNATPNGTPSPSPSPNASPSPNGGDLFAGLSGGTVNGVVATGFAQYELHSSRTELEVQVYQVNLSIGTPLAVNINNAAVGQLILESGGQGRLRLRSDRGQNVPVVTAGTTITIQNAGANILSGTFSGAAGSPSPSPTGSPSPSPTASPNETPSPSPSPSASPSPSPALGRYFEVHPTGSRVSPPVMTTANGEFKVFLNADETQATLTGEFHNLSSAQTSAKIATTIGAGAIIHDFGTVGGVNGNFAAVTIPVSAIQVGQLRAGLWFVTLGSADNPAGEIGGAFIQHSHPGDFDGDGNNDFAVFRPSTGTWYSQNSAGFRAFDFGAASDTPVSADYDGDGKTDAAVFKEVNGAGVWEIRRSSDGGLTVTQFGLAGDIPVRGDFDGDGRGDLATWRPSTGVWYVQNSNNTGYQIVQWGLSEDIPLATDMDGDGKSDFTVWRPSTGVWYWINSTNISIGVMQFGLPGDKPVKGDFDGDGRSDLVVFRPSTGVWYVRNSNNTGYQIVQWGLSDDIPLSTDMDGDGKSDFTVFRPSTGIWYWINSSTISIGAVQFGLPGDIPTAR